MRPRALRTTPTVLMEDGRDVALELRRLVHGDLCGMFDGPTTPGLRLDGPLVVLDLSAVYHSPALGVLMACAAAWLQSAVRAQHRNRIIVVVDEAWAILSNLGVARWLQTSWKLSRALGVANMAVLHRLSDLRSVGTAGSEQVNLAEGLLADSETRVVYAQSPGEVARTGELLGLTETEAELVTQLRRGTALWKVGRRSFLVEHRLASEERWLTDTDQAMSGRTAAGGPAGAVTRSDEPRATCVVTGVGAGRLPRRRPARSAPALRGPPPTGRLPRSVPGARHPLPGAGYHPGPAAPGGGGPVDHPAAVARASASRWAGARTWARWWCGAGPVTGPASPGRLVLGRLGRHLVVAEPAQSVIVFGPTQSHKTSGFAIPAILGWQGPVIATSIKTDLIDHTLGLPAVDRRRSGASTRPAPPDSTPPAGPRCRPPAPGPGPGGRRPD